MYDNINFMRRKKEKRMKNYRNKYFSDKKMAKLSRGLFGLQIHIMQGNLSLQKSQEN